MVIDFTLIWRPKGYLQDRRKNNDYLKKKKKKPTTVQICRLENIKHKSMKQVFYSSKYSLSASRAHQSHLQFSFVVGSALCPHFLHE